MYNTCMLSCHVITVADPRPYNDTQGCFFGIVSLCNTVDTQRGTSKPRPRIIVTCDQRRGTHLLTCFQDSLSREPIPQAIPSQTLEGGPHFNSSNSQVIKGPITRDKLHHDAPKLLDAPAVNIFEGSQTEGLIDMDIGSRRIHTRYLSNTSHQIPHRRNLGRPVATCAPRRRRRCR